MANDVKSDDEFDQPIYEEAQAGSKRKHSDCDDVDYVTSSEANDYFNMEDYKAHFRMWPEEPCVEVVFFLYPFELYINYWITGRCWSG